MAAQPPAEDAPKTLYRSRGEREIAGVCGGIAEYFRVDPRLVRIIALVLLFTPGSPGLIAYLIAWLILPEKPDDPPQDASAQQPEPEA